MLDPPFFVVLILALDFWLGDDAAGVCAFVDQEVYQLEQIVLMLNVLLKSIHDTSSPNFWQMSLLNRIPLKKPPIARPKISMHTLRIILHQEH